jgi:hypothetical protein
MKELNEANQTRYRIEADLTKEQSENYQEMWKKADTVKKRGLVLCDRPTREPNPEKQEHDRGVKGKREGQGQGGSLNFLSWNINRGLYNKELFFTDMLAKWNIDIALLQEVDLTDFDHNIPCTVPGYSTFTHPGQKKRTLTLVKQGSVSHAEEVQLELQGRPRRG